MLGSLAESLVGAVVGEMAGQGGRRTQREGPAYQQQQQPLPGPLESFVESVTELGKRALAATLTALQYILLLEALLLSAVVLYGALYWLVMPLRLHDKPLYFDYSNRARGGGATATVDLLAQHTQWEPSPLTNVGRLSGKILKAGQHYKVGLELEMPTSYTNRRVGVFMVHTTLLDNQDNELATSARPAMLPHTSGLRKGIGMFFSWPLHVLGLKSEADTVVLTLMDFYEENALHPLTKARVTVSSGRVQFYRASVHITPELKGLPWLMHDWFYSTLAAGVLFIASLELMLFGFCYVFFLGLELENPARNVGSSSSTSSNTDRRAAIRAGAARFTNVTASSSTGGRVAPRSPTRSWNTTSSVAGGRSVAEERGSPAVTHDEGLRRRQNVGGSGEPRGSITYLGEQQSVSTAGMSSSTRQSLPLGVQAYQRGARYVVPSRGVGDTGGATSEGTGGGGASPPSVQEASKEELDAAAMASWAALGGNIDERGERSAFEVQGGGGGRRGASGKEDGKAAVEGDESEYWSQGSSGRAYEANPVRTEGSTVRVENVGGTGESRVHDLTGVYGSDDQGGK